MSKYPLDQNDMQEQYEDLLERNLSLEKENNSGWLSI